MLDNIAHTMPLKKGEVWRNSKGFITLLWVDKEDVFVQPWNNPHKVDKFSRVHLLQEYKLVHPEEYLPSDYVFQP